MQRTRMAQYGTRHGHAEGKLLAMLRNPQVEVAGVYEPDQRRRAILEAMGEPWNMVRWFTEPAEILNDDSIVAVAAEGGNDESLDHAEAIVRAGKHLWYDKPAGENWRHWQRVVDEAEEQRLLIQMGYMFRYHAGFQRIADWAKSGLLGEIFAIRAHFSTSLSARAREVISVHTGGIFYDLAGHMLDQIVWLLGRPQEVTSFLRNDSGIVPRFSDNTLAVLSYPRALVTVDIAAMEAVPTARRFEVYGADGSAIMEPFEPAPALRLCLVEPRDGYHAGEQSVPLSEVPRQRLYELELEAFLRSVVDGQPPDRSLAHELLVQETLLRCTGKIRDEDGAAG